MINKEQKEAADKQRIKNTKILLKACKTRIELQKWIKHFLDIELPDTIVSRYANSTPFDAVWEQYSICVLKQNPKNIQELLYTASRGAGKCVEQGTLITTPTGLIPIENLKVGDEV